MPKIISKRCEFVKLSLIVAVRVFFERQCRHTSRNTSDTIVDSCMLPEMSVVVLFTVYVTWELELSFGAEEA